MNRLRHRLVYQLLLPAIVVATAVLGYYTWKTAATLRDLGDETIAESTLLLIREKVETIDRWLIGQENIAFTFPWDRDPNAVERKWLFHADRTPSIRAFLVLDNNGAVLAHASMDRPSEKAELAAAVVRAIRAETDPATWPERELRHIHVLTDAPSSLLLGATTTTTPSTGRIIGVVVHDTDAIVRNELPFLFTTEEGRRHYNVVDENNRLIYGSSLADAGDYLVGHRFPTTLYNWRLQVAPRQAPALVAQQRTRRAWDATLLLAAFLVLSLGVVFLMVASRADRLLNELKGEFIANVSHELKTPLSVIRMFGELLLSDRVRSAAKQKQYLEMIVRESERLSSLIENVLDFSALERGRAPYALKPGDLEKVARDTLQTFQYRVEHEAIELELVVPAPLPSVDLDEQAIVLAMMNLLDNAVKYGQKTPITVTIERVRNYVQLRVRDRGPGIPLDQEKRVFERFFRGADKGEIRGSGIGLAIVEHIAHSHGGRAFARNAIEGGAEVGFTIPIPDEP